MKKLLIKVAMAVSSKTQEQLAQEWNWHYFLTRSRLKAYWHAVFG